MKRSVSLLVLLAVLFGLGTGAEAKKLIIVGWDGAGFLNVQPMLERGELPNLKKILDAGGKLCPLETHTFTNTIPNWTLAFTGLTHDQTGVNGLRSFELYWEPFDDLAKRVRRFNKKDLTYMGLNFWVAEVPYANTIFDDLQAKGIRLGWFVSKADFLGSDPLLTPLHQIPKHADAFLAMDPDLDMPTRYLRALCNAASRFVEEKGDDYVVFLHMNPDEFGHHYGENSKEYLGHIRRCDDFLGKILAVANDADWLVIADHGFDEGSTNHRNAPDLWMATTLPVHPAYEFQPSQRAFGSMRDVAPTILDWFDVDWKSLTPKMRGKSLLR